ncbi:MAG: hypothetical protein AAF657_28685 [Acidobacteriota bacterium]
MSSDAPSSLADELLDDVLPEGLDWRGMVVSYPVAALALSVAGGYLLGRRHGTAILDALSRFAADEVDRNVSALIGRDDDENSARD